MRAWRGVAWCGLIALTACGGGGGGSSSAIAPGGAVAGATIRASTPPPSNPSTTMPSTATPSTALPTVPQPLPQAIQWSLKAPMVYQRDNTANAVLNGQIYVLGGAPAGTSVLSYVERYDIPSNTWTTMTSMNVARYGPTASAVNGVIYAIGGTTAVDGSGAITAIEVYDPVSNTWSLTVPSNALTIAAGTVGQTLAPLPTPRWGLRSVVIDGLIYAVAGAFKPTGATKEVYYPVVEAYDPVHNTWTTKAPMPVAYVGQYSTAVNGREGAAVALVDGIMYVIGGWGGWPELTLVQAYDPKADLWYSTVPTNAATTAAGTVGQSLADMPTARDDFGYGVVNGRIYAISGDTNTFSDYYRTSCCTAVVESYDPVANTWRSEATALLNRDDFESSVVASEIYNLAGSRDGIFTNNPTPPTGLPPAAPLTTAFLNANQGGYSLTTNEVGLLSSIPVPTGLTASVASGQVTWSWSAVAGATSYRLYWSLLPGVTTKALTSQALSGLTGTQTSLPTTSLSTTAHWAYAVVTAVTASGESLPSDEVAVQW